MKFLTYFIQGLLIGIGAVAPGVSGGSLAVLFGLYERITDAIANVFKNFKKDFIFFLPIVLGGGVGVLVFSNIMKYLFLYYDIQVKYLFIGLMVGTLPTVFKQANIRGFRRIYILPCIFALSVTLISVYLDNRGINVIPDANPGLLQLMGYGAVIGIGTIVPGISASFMLMYLGAYQLLLEGLSGLNPSIIIPVGIGFGLSIIAFAKIVNYMFRRFYGYTYYTVLGFVTGSIVAIFPGVAFDLKHLVSILLLFIGLYISLVLSSKMKEE